MSAATQMKDKEMAAHLKKLGVVRRTMTCPMGNHQIPVGQNSLLAHIPCPTHHKKVNK